MADYTSLAIHDIRSYMWESLKNDGILSESEYYADGYTSPLVPIIPSQQIPEFNNLLPGKLYITYETEMLPVLEQWWITEEVLYLSIISPDYDKINTVINYFTDIFRRYDESARDLRSSNIISDNFIFHYTAINKIKSPAPMKQEGGLRAGSMSILYSYSRKNNSENRFL